MDPEPLSAEEEAIIRESFAEGMRQGRSEIVVFAREDIARLLATLDAARSPEPLDVALRDAAEFLAGAEKAMAEEYLMLIAAKVNSYQAQKQAEHKLGTAVRRATAEYEIALARLRKG